MRPVLVSCALLLASPHLAAAATVDPGGIPFRISFTATFEGDACSASGGADPLDAALACEGIGVFETDDGPRTIVDPDGPYRGRYDALAPDDVSTGLIVGVAIARATPGLFDVQATCTLFGLPCGTDGIPGEAVADTSGGVIRLGFGFSEETAFLFDGPDGRADYAVDLFVADYRAGFVLSDVDLEIPPAVPLPASLPLLALGAAALFRLRRDNIAA